MDDRERGRIQRQRHSLTPWAVGLLGCGKSKQTVAAPARLLYTGQLFALGRQYLEDRCRQWFILSAQHGLLHPDSVIEPYDLSLASLSPEQRRHWALGVRASLEAAVPDLNQGMLVLAGQVYVRALTETLGRCLANPLLGLGIGQRLAWLKRHLADPVIQPGPLTERPQAGRRQQAQGSVQRDLFEGEE